MRGANGDQNPGGRQRGSSRGAQVRSGSHDSGQPSVNRERRRIEMAYIKFMTSRDAVLAFALWLLGTIYLGENLGPTRLLIEMTVEASDGAVVYFSADGHWNTAQATSLPVLVGYNRLNFTLPGNRLGDSVRFDPGERATSYRFHSAIWLRAGVTWSVPLNEITNLNSETGRLSIDHGQLELDADAANPQLIVPCPPWTWTVGSALAWPGLPVGALVLVLIGLRRRFDSQRIAGVFVAAIALFYFFYCLRFGPSLPIYDDWRYLTSDQTNLVDGNWRGMIVVSNDTFFLTSQLFDFVLLKLSNVDFAWVRVFGMALLLLQLAVQYRVIGRAAREQPFVAAIAVALGFWSLTNNGYWGAQALAYQQALPTLFGTLCLVQVCASNGRFSARFSSLLLALCCVASGVSYISGGPLLMSLGIACVLQAKRILDPRSDPEARAGWIVFGLGVASLIFQVFMVTQRQGALLEHNHAVASIFPNDRRFWLFFFALFGRALGYDGTSTSTDGVLAALILAPGVFLGIQRLAAGDAEDSRSRGICAMLAIYAAIGSVTYAAIVAFGRAGFIPVDASTEAAVTFAKSRFHYWPIAAMLPYVWLGWATIAQHLRYRSAVLHIVAASLLLPKSLAVFDQNPSFLYARTMTKRGAHCVTGRMADIDAGRPVACVEMTGGSFDVGPVVLRLRARNSPTYERFLREGGAPDYHEHADLIFRGYFDADTGKGHPGP